MEFKSDKFNTRFVVPDRITVRQQLAYFSEATNFQASKALEKRWAASCQLITEWESKLLPDRNTPLDDVTDSEVTSLIIWVGLEIMGFMNKLDSIPKN